MSQQPTRSGALLGLLHALEYTTLALGLYALNSLILPVLFGAACLAILARRCWDWCRRRPLPRRIVAACILAFCTPRPIDTTLYDFCYPENV